MAKPFDVYAAVDQCLSALDFLGKSMLRAKPAEKVRAAIDAYTHCQQWLIEQGHQNTFIDLRMRADQLIANRDLLNSVPYDEDTWAYYLTHMPAYAAAMDSLISDNHELNALVVHAVARDECKTDPYVMPAFCSLLLKHRDWRSWQSYISDRRHTDSSKIPALCSLHALHPDDMTALTPFLSDFLSDHPWKEKILFKDISGLRRENMRPLYEVAITTGHPGIADNLFLSHRWDSLPLDHLQYFVKQRPQVLDSEWRMSAISNANTNSKRGSLDEMESYVVLAYAAFCGINQDKESISQLNQNCNLTTQLKFLGGISKMRREQPEMFGLVDIDMVTAVVEQYFLRDSPTQEEIEILLTDSYQVEADFYIHTNVYKRMMLSEDLAL